MRRKPFFLLAVFWLAASSDWGRADDDVRAPAASEFEEAPQKFVPRRLPSEAEQDRVEASVRYAAARLQLQRDDLPGALRNFERAWRYDSSLVSVHDEIVSLALRLRRPEEAARYAVLAQDLDLGATVVLLRLAAIHGEQRDWPQAARLYERIVELQKEVEPDFSTVMIQMELGRIYFLLDRSADAAQAFAKVREALDNPDKHGLNEQYVKLLLEKPEATYTLFGEAFFSAKRWDEAQAMFQRADQLRPDPRRAAFLQARIEFAKQRYAAAAAAFAPFWQNAPEDLEAEPCALLAQVEFERARAAGEDEPTARRRVVERLAELAQKFPDRPALVLALAAAQVRVGQYDDAVRRLEALAAAGDSEEVLFALRDVRWKARKWAPLVELLQRSAASATSLGQLEELIEPLTPDVQAVQEITTRTEQGAAERKPGAALLGAVMAYAGQRYDDADRLFELAAKEEAPGAAIVYPAWGLGMFAVDQGARAARVFQRAIDEKVRPEANATFYYFLAGSLELQGQTDAALAAAKQAAAGGANSPQFQLRLAWIPFHARRYDEAEREYRRLLEKFESAGPDPAFRDAAREARTALSSIASVRGKSAEAAEWLEQVLDEHPEDASALNNLGYQWAEQGVHLERALRMCQAAVKAEPASLAYRDSLGWALHQLGRHAEALPELQRAAAGEEPSGVVLDHLGDCFAKLGRLEEARQAWRRALEVFDEDERPRWSEATRKKLEAP
ncbi:MAG: tetratricopeptide repeat protein [Pirellulales bacterium]